MSQANLDRRGSTAVAVELYQWRPEWGLGSMDPNCLAANIYLTMCGVRYRKNDCNNPAMSPRGYLPFLKVEETGLWELDEIFQYADNQSPSGVYIPSGVESVEVRAFTALVQDKIYPAILYSLWCDSANYQAVTQPIYGNMYTWPVSWILPSRMRSQAVQAVGDVTGGRPWKEIQADAATAFVALSNRLGGQQ
eukprot:comp17570_c0_seq1/m.17183 comp17570_c0_seq1/g.17183  ORF comp17570_c0_seq1/g.17183 comp17570_c0_seq1/m.17183 type:complete len:193 (-) comp17570_c0_seq1:14-592(-)